ncbi:MAG: glycosyltransferase family 2 protein [bacterium]|nr:glycosyltransferase family 2 protein [bacterium]
MTLSILITHYKALPMLRLCLHSIREHLGGITDKEIIVMDSAAESGTKPRLAREFPEAQYIGFSDNVGYGRLVNAGIRASQGSHLVIINHDIVFTHGAVERLLDFLDNHPGTGIVAPQLCGFNGKPMRSCFRYYDIWVVAGRRTFLRHIPRIRRKIDRFLMAEVQFSGESAWPVDWVQGSALATLRTTVERVGLFDERFFMYFEDVDWCRRFWENGYAVMYLTTATLYHWHGQASRRYGGVADLFFNKYALIHLASAVKYFFKHGFHQPHHGT